jgi:outer membrane protein TolC
VLRRLYLSIHLHFFCFVFFLFLGLGRIQYLIAQDTGEHPAPLTLKEAIFKNLLQQPAIRVSLYNIEIQRGITQSSAAPFDPVVNSQFFHTYSRDLLNLDQNINALNLGQNLTPLDGIPNNTPVNIAPVIPTQFQDNIPCSCPVNSSCLDQFSSCSSSGSCSNQCICSSVNQNTTAICPPAIHTDFQAHETTAHLDVSRKFREGTRIVFSVDIDQYKNPIFCPRRLNVGKVTAEIDQPLLRGRQYGLDYMIELANKQEISAVRYDTFQTISQQVFTTVSFYWNVLGAKKILVSQRESEERLKAIVENVKFLIQRGQLAPTDLLQPIAQLSTQIVSRIQAEQTLFDAWQQLKFAMGEWDEIYPCPVKEFDIMDEFPSTALDPYAFPSIFCSLFPNVFQLRFDILASITREEEYILLLKGAKNLELPQLDVVGRVTVTDFTSCSRSENFFSSLDFERPQQDYTIGVVFSTPFFRDEAKGLIRQRQAQWLQAQANTQLIKQQALADISAALKDQIKIQEEIKKAKDAVDEYHQLLVNEKKKLIAGYSTIFFLLNFEASLTTAMVTYVQLQNQLANNIAKIRFLTGTLIQFSPCSDGRSFVVGDAITLPFNTNNSKGHDEGRNGHER